MKKPSDITGQRFGRLMAIERCGYTKNRISVWRCVCECGGVTETRIDALRRGTSKSCGCRSREIAASTLSATNHKHGHAHRGLSSREYVSWRSMYSRCMNRKAPGYSDYGGRGISVCARWLDFVNFATDMGPRPPNTSLGRVDVNGDYEPPNCRWETPYQQANNTRRTVRVSIDGKEMSLKQAAAHIGVSYSAVRSRMRKRGLSPMGALLWAPRVKSKDESLGGCT